MPRTVRVLGLPTQEELDSHSTTHLPYRSWSPAWSQTGRAGDRAHKRIPEAVFGYVFLGSEEDCETAVFLVIRGRRTNMLSWYGGDP